MFSRYEGDSENGYALVRLLKLCSNLDPRFMNMTEQSKEDLVVKAVAVGAFMCDVNKGHKYIAAQRLKILWYTALLLVDVPFLC